MRLKRAKGCNLHKHRRICSYLLSRSAAFVCILCQHNIKWFHYKHIINRLHYIFISSSSSFIVWNCIRMCGWRLRSKRDYLGHISLTCKHTSNIILLDNFDFGVQCNEWKLVCYVIVMWRDFFRGEPVPCIDYFISFNLL